MASKATPVAENATTQENPRTKKSQEKLDLAKQLIMKELESGEWVSSNAIHKKLAKQISEGIVREGEDCTRRDSSPGSPRGRGQGGVLLAAPNRQAQVEAKREVQHHDEREGELVPSPSST